MITKLRKFLSTTNYSDFDPQEYKRQISFQWGHSPCGASYAGVPIYSETPEFFRSLTEYRYKSHPWILSEIEKLAPAGKKVLEIGVGLGSDHVAFIKLGAAAYGLDLTPAHLLATQNHLKHQGEPPLLIRETEKIFFLQIILLMVCIPLA